MLTELLEQENEVDEIHGFVENMPFEEYAKVPALNGSSIVHMRRSPMSYRWHMDNPSPETPATRLGTLTHRLILEPELVGELAIWGVKEEQKVRRGGVWDQFCFDNQHCTIVTDAEYEAMTKMAANALMNAPIKKYASASGVTEVSMFWRHPHTKRRYKARVDKIITDSHTIFDLKTTRDCHSYRFGGQAYALGYHLKMAHYWAGYKILTGVEPTVILGAIDSKAPHESAVYRVTRDVLLQGLEELDNLIARLDDCEKANSWPGEYEVETDLLLPTWAMSDAYGDGEVEG
jgi:hypothetical protein